MYCHSFIQLEVVLLMLWLIVCVHTPSNASLTNIHIIEPNGVISWRPIGNVVAEAYMKNIWNTQVHCGIDLP